MATKRSTEWFVAKAREIHGGRYDYDKTIYQIIKAKVCTVCPEHDGFLKSPENICLVKAVRSATRWGNFRLASGLLKRLVKFMAIAMIVCPEHDEFWQRPDHHLEGARP